MDFSFFFVRQQTFFPYGFLAFRQIRHIFSCETLFGSFLSLLFQSSIFCCLALEDGSQYPSFSSLIPKIFLLLLHSSVFHASAIFSGYLSSFLVPMLSLHYKKYPTTPQWFFLALLLRDCVTSLRSCKCLPWQPNDVRAKFTCFLP